MKKVEIYTVCTTDSVVGNTNILRLIIFPFSPKYGTLSEEIGFHTAFHRTVLRLF